MAEQQGYADNNYLDKSHLDKSHLDKSLPDKSAIENHAGPGGVRGEINSVLTEARQALERHLSDPGNPTHLEACLNRVGQVHNTLKMLQQVGATLLAEELKKLLEALSRKAVQDLDVVHECLMQSILQLPAYIEQAVHSGMDRPMPLLPLINKMRSLRGADALSRAVFFYPPISGFPPSLSDEQIQKLKQSGLTSLLPKIRQKYQVVLAAYLREQHREQQLQVMARIFAKLQNLCWDAPLSPLWEACIALVEGLQNDSIKQTLHITNLLRSVDLQLRSFVIKGPSFINTTPDDQLFRGLLYFIALSDDDGSFGSAMKARYKLHEALNNSEGNTFVGNEAAPSVMQALNDELAGIKDAFDLYLLATEPDPLILQNQLPIIQQVSGTLSMLGLEEQGQQVLQFKQQLHDVIESRLSSRGSDAETALMAIATGLLKLETVLHQFANGQQADSTPLLNEAFVTVIEQTRENLEQTKDAITEYVDHQFDQSYLRNACDLLQIAYGGLGMTPFTSAADVIRQCADFINSQWIENPGNLPDKQALENTAEVVTAIEYYLDRLADPGTGHSDTILETAQESLSKLLEVPVTPGPVGIATYTPEPVENNLSAFTSDNLTLVEIEQDTTEPKRSSKAVFQIDDPQEELPESLPELPEDLDSAIEFTPEKHRAEPATTGLIDEDLLEVFREEASDVQAQLASLIPQWQSSADRQPAILSDIRRSFHTLKGSGRMVEANVIGELAWSIENMLNRLIEGTTAFNPDMLNLIARANNMLPALLDDYIQDNELLTPDVLVCMEMADALANGEQYLAPEHPDAPEEDDDNSIAVQFGEVISDQPEPVGLIPPQQLETTGITSDEDQLLTVFQTEARDHLETIQTFINNVRNTGNPLQISDSVHRALHTLKGITQMSGFDTLAQLVNALEYHVKEFKSHNVPADEEVTRTLQEGCLLIADALNQLIDNPTELYLDSDGYLSWLDILHQQLIPQSEAQSGKRLLPAEGLEYLLLADTLPELWQQGIDHSQLKRLLKDLDTLGQRCREQQLQPVAELSDILKDICNYLDSHATTLPEPLVKPLTNGFDALLNMLNQTAGQQTPEPSQAVFTGLRHALEALLLHEEERHEEPVKAAADHPIQHNIEVEEIELLDLFLDEAFEISEDAHQALKNWIKETSSPEPVKELQRLLHSLKGGARMSEQPDLADLSHALEGVYELIASRLFTRQTWTADIPLGLMQASHNHIDQMLQALKADQPVPDAFIYIQKLNEWQAQHQNATGDKPEALTVEPEFLTTDEVHHLPDYLAQPSVDEPPGDIQQDAHASPVSRQLKQNREMVRVSAELFEHLINLSGESSITRSRIEQEVTEIRHTLDEMETTISRLTEQLRRLDLETQTQILSRYEGEQHTSDFDPLEMDRYSGLTQLSHSLMESATDLADLRLAVSDKNSETESLLLQQSRTQIQLQDKLIQARMVSFARLLPRLKKITAQVSEELKKTVKLNVQNAEGEMDRTMLDRILSPLEYLIRHAISHSIEDADDRRATGKTEAGQLELVVKREGAEIVLELHDDGEGIDVDAIQTKAVEMHLIAPDDQLPDSDLIQLILEPGFSTTDTSAHSVGLDRVNTEIRQMGGSMQIESTRGKGCCFRLRLPFTLSMHRVLVVQAGDSLYALPLQSIAGVTTIAANTLLSCFQDLLPLEFAGEEYQVLTLGQLTGNTAPEIREASCHMVLLDRGGQKYALQVDELIGRRDIVSKNPGPQFATLSGVKGATILGDGRVVIVIDPAALIRQFRVNQYYAHQPLNA
ncbi:Hpt domain-containing protein [Endozoicomonas gorgoniicola]|uniref:histidine kinase n=1 Tax=Endozoicomonas gorgoniicola TaxID=1234144 RepID=A0ABT3N009_9GAMM|nr:Hpt domain-containing protein [Endozoicomonas gorgoniicola]MCW7554944.1 Hpt domain-containing protein [Endozoicomonas gorgoniicola]